MNRTTMSLFDEFTCGGMGRRDFFDRVARAVGGSAAALALAPVLAGEVAQSPLVPAADRTLVVGPVAYDAEGVKMSGYLARPTGGTKRPAVIVISENRGLTPHIQDVVRRFGQAGFLALAPDMLSPLGGTPEDSAKAVQMIGSLNPNETVARLAATVRYLAAHAESTGKVGAVGFCWGGGQVNSLAAAGTSLNAGVAYYGRQIPASDVPKITAPLLLHYAVLDERINAGIAAYEAALKAGGKVYELYMYEGANHAFNNDTNAERYNKPAADLAWSRTITFFKKYLVP